eukprot:1300794-Pleurochrysis_carterae.AAC.1
MRVGSRTDAACKGAVFRVRPVPLLARSAACEWRWDYYVRLTQKRDEVCAEGARLAGQQGCE